MEQFGGCRRGTTHTLGATTLVRHRLNSGGECLRIKGASFEFCQGGVWIDEPIPFNFVSLAARFPIAKYDCGGNWCREGSPYIRIKSATLLMKQCDCKGIVAAFNVIFCPLFATLHLEASSYSVKLE